MRAAGRCSGDAASNKTAEAGDEERVAECVEVRSVLNTVTITVCNMMFITGFRSLIRTSPASPPPILHGLTSGPTLVLTGG